ncbi:DHA2 family efflux MFS transporter permease subunit [Bacillus sp. JJ722]|uniref:DHA2 family efflux MFS transporter permease subunit n=1 Tax=Bacillus sp. JJ722 TaxID=3122973 RepID=UPI002FFFCF6B
MIALMMSGFIGLFSETALNMAFTNIMTEFQIKPSAVQWLTTGYLLVLGILVPVSALLIQWFTTRQLFIASLVFSILGTVVAAFSFSFELLLMARVIQAIGTGLLLPLMTNVILVIFPPHKRGAAMGTMGLVIMFAPALGPTISGLIVDSLGWQWIFWICLPLLIFALGFGIIYMQNVSTITKPKIDILSIFLSTIGFGGIVLGFSSAGEAASGWTHPNVIIAITVGVIGLILFSLRQMKMDQPMINLRVFKYPLFSLAVVMVFVTMMIILASAILLPMYLKGGLALTALAAGLVLLPGGVVNGLMSPICGKLFDKYGPKWLVIPGFLLTTIMTFFLSRITTATEAILIVVLHCLLFIGIAFIMMPAQTNGLNELPRKYYPDGSAVMNTLSQIAGAIGTAIAISIMSSGQQNYLAETTEPTNPTLVAESLVAGIQNAFLFAFVASVIGLVIAFFTKRADVD